MSSIKNFTDTGTFPLAQLPHEIIREHIIKDDMTLAGEVRAISSDCRDAVDQGCYRPQAKALLPKIAAMLAAPKPRCGTWLMQTKLERYVKADELVTNIFGSMGKYLDLPVLSIKGKDSKYLDFFKPSDMSAPIMRGRDDYGREFLAFKYSRNGNEPEVQVFHERYTDCSPGYWVKAGACPLIPSLDSCDASDRTVQYLRELAEKGTVTIALNFYGDVFVNHEFTLVQ